MGFARTRSLVFFTYFHSQVTENLNTPLILRIIIFLAFNFSALAIGSLFTTSGVSSEWYSNLNKAPRTPPGWMFGAAWTTIMICFSVYMAYLWPRVTKKTKLIWLFAAHLILNTAWNPMFFKFHLVGPALADIIGLTLLVGYFLIAYRSKLQGKSILILPYFIWLLIATSLNAYILAFN